MQNIFLKTLWCEQYQGEIVLRLSQDPSSMAQQEIRQYEKAKHM